MFTRAQLIYFINNRNTIIGRQLSSRFTNGDGSVHAIFDVLLSSKFRKGALNPGDKNMYYELYKDSIERRIRAGLPIQITLLGAPFKNQNPIKNNRRTLPDMAEVGFMLKMYEMQVSIKKVYEPGIEVVLIHDGVYYAEPCNIPIEDALKYREYFRNILTDVPDFSFIISHELTDLLAHAGIDEKQYSKKASDMARQWMQSADYRHEVAAAYKRAICSICPDDHMREQYIRSLREYLEKGSVTDSKIHELILRAVYLYKKKQTVIYTMRDPRKELFPDAIHASASRHEGKLPLWLVKRGKALLPWHGVGVVYDSASICVEYEEDVCHSKKFHPIFLEGERSPFFYSEISEEDLMQTDLFSGSVGNFYRYQKIPVNVR